MFRQLALCTEDEQEQIVKGALLIYAAVWFAKHPGSTHPDIISDVEHDAADAEFENALIEMGAGMSNGVERLERIRHFAAAVRSSVLAVQIWQWIRDYPEEYESWREGRAFSGPTFLDDPKADIEAEKAWIWIDSLFSMKAVRSQRRRLRPSKSDVAEIEREYRKWSDALL